MPLFLLVNFSIVAEVDIYISMMICANPSFQETSSFSSVITSARASRSPAPYVITTVFPATARPEAKANFTPLGTAAASLRGSCLDIWSILGRWSLWALGIQWIQEFLKPTSTQARKIGSWSWSKTILRCEFHFITVNQPCRIFGGRKSVSKDVSSDHTEQWYITRTFGRKNAKKEAENNQWTCHQHVCICIGKSLYI